MTLSQELISILVCPKCRQDVTVSTDGRWIVCMACRIKYPVLDDIPVMLVDEAVPLGDE